jgi:hypothetical protein
MSVENSVKSCHTFFTRFLWLFAGRFVGLDGNLPAALPINSNLLPRKNRDFIEEKLK